MKLWFLVYNVCKGGGEVETVIVCDSSARGGERDPASKLSLAQLPSSPKPCLLQALLFPTPADTLPHLSPTLMMNLAFSLLRVLFS